MVSVCHSLDSMLDLTEPTIKFWWCLSNCLLSEIGQAAHYTMVAGMSFHASSSRDGGGKCPHASSSQDGGEKSSHASSSTTTGSPILNFRMDC